MSDDLEKREIPLNEEITKILGAKKTDATLPVNASEGELLGTGKVVAFLGQGGMARVYKTWNEELEVYRAVKVLAPTDNKDFTKRFWTEAKLTAKLDHPNIVTIFNVGTWKNYPYLEMELIEGVSLEELLTKSGKLPPYICIGVCIMVARALAYAHTLEFTLSGNVYNGIIHRDLKPANIMISSTGAVKLMDFGIARPVQTGLHTTCDFVVGTLPYLAPEQINLGTVDQRTDIYTFGAILYELLSGRKAFPESNLMVLVTQKSQSQYTPLHELLPNSSPQLSAIVDRCMKVKPEERYSDAEVLLSALMKAHGTLTSESPEAILRKFVESPNYEPAPATSSIPVPQKRSAPMDRKTLFTRVAIVSGIVALGVIFTFFARSITNDKITTPTPSDTIPSPLMAKGPSLSDSAADTQKSKAVSTKDTTQQNKPDSTHVAMTTPNKEIVTKKTVSPPKTTVPEKPAPSAFDLLSAKYDSRDPAAIVEAALSERQLDDAKIAATLLKGPQSESNTIKLKLASAFLDRGKAADARSILRGVKSNDALYHIGMGRILLLERKYNDALLHFETALSLTSAITNESKIQGDVYYFSAVVLGGIYRATPSSENSARARNAWKQVHSYYEEKPQNPRYIEASVNLTMLSSAE